MEETLFQKIRNEVKKIPKGFVSTYGIVARKCGITDARKVGWAIYNNQNSQIPCHRVVNKDGYLAEKFSLGGWSEQKKRLIEEGVIFIEEKKVDLNKCLYN